MAQPKIFAVDLDLTKNQLLNAVLQNLATHPPSPKAGQMYYNTTDGEAKQWDGTEWRPMGGNNYTHPSFTARTLNTSGASILASIEVNEEGHVVTASTRTLTLDDLGYSPYSHPTFAGNDLGAALTGSKVISDVEVDAEGHVTGFVTRDLTAADIGAAVINDAATNADSTWSGQKIANEIASALAGGMDFKGNYDADSNTPNLDSDPTGVLKGDTYAISTAGAFFTQDVQVGDVIIAKVDDPTTLEDWTFLERNLPAIGDATTLVRGIIQLATEAEALAGTDNTKAITPLTLKAVIDERTSGVTKKYAANVGDGSATSIMVNHNLGTTDVDVTVKEASGREIICAVTATDANNVTLGFNTAPGTNAYRAVIIG